MKLETRTLKEIFASLTPGKRAELKSSLAYELQVTDRSVDNWTRRGMVPGNYSQRKDVVRVVNKILGIRTTTKTLFPFA